ncbi:pyridoxamine 5'-phosphate oxidase family protein [Roseibium sediminicola]|uniref:Pyridoxamine 5'-phosphate oxidase family protein n=1 Tax=Roseibium sediminicola TaxID=2933272 RepID=A0ABT0H2A4_9HYPH|nr:pyridoxamine 5'-phosphate oxidase family protein [Roseibium sp. CAU 1639]MCK7615819.1 pyridoxamine 5'-phosphate oxidase family protein [Roseibium sp. CAU 1639]
MFDQDQTRTPTEDLSPFHEGEQHVQEKLGDSDVQRWARGAIRHFMPDQHRQFFEEQPFLVVSGRDGGGRPWATLLEGGPGFVRSPEAASLEIAALPVAGDALENALTAGADIGLIGIELATRRRNRANGIVASADGGGLKFALSQSFGNCPQYIRARKTWWSPERPEGKAVKGTRLSAVQRSWIGSADTFFIASGYRGVGDNPAFGMDVSHKGGEPGFVEVLDEKTLRFPDYAGNKFYNTLGNILNDPRAGLLFVDFASGNLLQLTGRASVDWDSDAVANVPGARQLVTLEIDAVVELSNVLRLRWQEEADTARDLRLVQKTRESADVTSFVFGSRDGGPLPSFEAGQHLTIELHLAGGLGKVQRSYSLSGAPQDGHYRISVKREPQGLVSRILHDVLEVGAVIGSSKPAGDFVVPDDAAPLVLVGAGIGVTPLISMLHQLAARGDRRPVWFVHGVRDGAHHPFRGEAARLAEALPNVRHHAVYSRPTAEDAEAGRYDTQGRISGAFLTKLVDRSDARYLLCGPAAFLTEVTADLQRHGVPEDRIAFETF